MNSISSDAFSGILESALKAAHAVVDNPDEFSPELVASADKLIVALSAAIEHDGYGNLVTNAQP